MGRAGAELSLQEFFRLLSSLQLCSVPCLRARRCYQVERAICFPENGSSLRATRRISTKAHRDMILY